MNMFVKILLPVLSILTLAEPFSMKDPCHDGRHGPFEYTNIPMRKLCTGDKAVEGCNDALKADILKHFHPDLAVQNLSSPLCVIKEYYGQPGRDLYAPTTTTEMILPKPPGPDRLPAPTSWCCVSGTYMDKDTQRREKFQAKLVIVQNQIGANVFYKYGLPGP
ncbi:hypothetical protein WDU94_010455 [Cyamophila willieti]